MKETFCLIAGVVGGFIATLLGGWDNALVTLVIFMGIDFVTGVVTAMMGRSKHSKSGTLNSKAGWIGLAKKFCVLLMVVVGVRIDILLGTTYIRDTVCIDWAKVKANFVILRAGYGKVAKQKDDRFEEYYAGAKARGIPVGAYWYSYAMDENEARLEADVFLAAIQGKQFEYPVFYDVEESKQFELGKEKLSAIIRAFLERVEAAGYFVGLYGSASSLVTHTENDIKEKYTIWLAHWCENTNYSGAYGIWQHSCKGKVDGISGDVDLDKCYVDYPERIKAKRLNGYGTTPTSAPLPDDSVSVEVTVDGKKYSGKLNKT